MELSFDTRVYQTGTMDAFSQLHVARKLGPALPILQGLVDETNAGKDPTLLVVLILSRLTDEETEYVISKCMGVVSRKQEQGWAKLYTNGSLMFSDTTMNEIIRLTAQVIVENLGDFFRTALASLAQGAEKA